VSSGILGLLAGLVLCFLGVGSLHLAVLGSGFALGWLIAELFGAGVGTTVLIGLGGAALAWVVVTLVFRFGAFFVGSVAGGVIGARIVGVAQAGRPNVLLAIVTILAVAAVCGLLTARYTSRFLMWVCALGGAGFALTGLSRIAPDALGFLRHPDTALAGVVSVGAWLVLALLGRNTQRRLFPKALHVRDQES
jgi:hypothetical protein